MFNCAETCTDDHRARGMSKETTCISDSVHTGKLTRDTHYNTSMSTVQISCSVVAIVLNVLVGNILV
jgi:hypothetical protein